MNGQKDIIISFFAGFIPSGIKTFFVFQTLTPFTGFMIKLIGSMVVGVCGGFAGILGKDIYKYCKIKIISKLKK